MMDISVSRDQLEKWAESLDAIPDNVLVYYGPGGCTEMEWGIAPEVSPAWEVAQEIRGLLERKEDHNGTSV